MRGRGNVSRPQSQPGIRGTYLTLSWSSERALVGINRTALLWQYYLRWKGGSGRGNGQTPSANVAFPHTAELGIMGRFRAPAIKARTPV